MNDYAHFCLGRSLEKTGRHAEARRHAALAANMRPDRKDYQAFRDRLQTRLKGSDPYSLTKIREWTRRSRRCAGSTGRSLSGSGR